MGAEIWAIAAVGVALAGLILSLNRSLRGDMAEMRRDMAELRRDVIDLRDRIADLYERMARLEGMFEGFTGRRSDTP